MGKLLGGYIKTTRKSRRIAAAKLSGDVNISKSYLDYIENGQREPSIEILAKIAVSLDVSLGALQEFQRKERLALALGKLREESVEAVDHAAKISKACALVEEALESTLNISNLSDYIDNKVLRDIVRALAELGEPDLAKIKNVIGSMHPEIFVHKGHD